MLKGASMGEISPSVWVGSEEAAQQQELLKGRIKNVLIVGTGTFLSLCYAYHGKA